jgi:hypothetical protein
MKKCIYCRKHKDDSEFTLEHVIPQFLGGAYSPEIFKIRDVCKPCNSNLGLFVDAGFEKNWIVSNKLRDAAYRFFDPNNAVGLPLICMGNSDLTPPNIEEDEICELWLGPLGEQVYWVRPNDERLYWYTGGNPITTKTKLSRAYYLFSEQSQNNPNISWLAFRDSFDGKRVKKIMCTQVNGGNPSEIGFKKPDDLDVLRIDYFLKHTCDVKQERQNKLSFYTLFDLRFLAKLGIGIAYSLFGEKALETQYAEELYKALNYREDQKNMPDIIGSSIMHGNNKKFSELAGIENAVTILIFAFPEGVLVNLNIGASLNWSVMCASPENLRETEISKFRDGEVIILFKQLQKGITLSFSDFILHNAGKKSHIELSEICEKTTSFKNYIESI